MYKQSCVETNCIEPDLERSHVIKIKLATRKSRSIPSNLKVMKGLDFCTLNLRSTFLNLMIGHYPCSKLTNRL